MINQTFIPAIFNILAVKPREVCTFINGYVIGMFRLVAFCVNFQGRVKGEIVREKRVKSCEDVDLWNKTTFWLAEKWNEEQKKLPATTYVTEANALAALS